MSLIRVASFSLSIDGFGAGPSQSLEHPLGLGGEELHEWVFATRTFQGRVLRNDVEGLRGVDDDYAARGFFNIGAWVIGRNMFGPIRGPWHDDTWRGWWGDDPPYHTPVFVLTHHPRASLPMQGGTTFHFVTDGLASALQQARRVAGDGRDVRIGGGVATVRAALVDRLVDEVHLAIAPAVLGRGERLYDGLDLRTLGYEVVEHAATDKATHVVLRRIP